MRRAPTRVLVLAYYYPPVGGAGVQRTTAFCHLLPAHGYEPVVVTGRGASGRWTPEDRSLAAGLEHRIHRVVEPEPGPAGGSRIADRLTRLGLVRGRWARWWYEGALAAGREALREGPVCAVFTSMSPYESAPVAARLASEAAVPWIADLRDPWALDEMVVYPSALHRRRAMARMGRDLSSADAVVMNTPGAAAAAIAAFPDLRNVHAIPNGYDPDDFTGPPPAPRGDRVLRIVHTGYLHTALGQQHRTRRASWRGGEREPVDILARSHVYLLEAIAGLPPATRDSVELHLAGTLSRADEIAIETSPAADRVRTHGYLGHAASVELVRGADLLFCPMHDLPAGGSALIVPGKTYEYIAAGRPILAAMPAGDARELVRTSGTGRVCSPTDVAAMRTIIGEELEALRNGRDPLPVDQEILHRHARPQIAAELARVLDAVTAARRPLGQTTPRVETPAAGAGGRST
jgi:glycosyltransferase involved in cell wall biosynthesis